MQRVRNFFLEAYYFVTSFVFWKHFLAMIATTIFLIWLLFYGLQWYTMHGTSVEVPNLMGLTEAQAQQLLSTRSLELKIIAESYDPLKTPSTILEQTPKAGDRVKESRTIYITVNAARPPDVNITYKMFIGKGLTDVVRRIEGLKLKVGTLSYIDGRGENTVAEIKVGTRILFKEADPTKGIRPPTQAIPVPQGTVIDLVLYKGEDADLKPVPDWVCLPYSAAELGIAGNGFMKGDIILEPGITDTVSAFVYRQEPMPNSFFNLGTGVTLWLAKELPAACKEKDLNAN